MKSIFSKTRYPKNINDSIPAKPQYIANHSNLPLRTMLIIHLHAKQPDKNAAAKPAKSATGDIVDTAIVSAVSPISFIPSSNASPNIGGITIKNEN